jgi:hypothetical protein
LDSLSIASGATISINRRTVSGPAGMEIDYLLSKLSDPIRTIRKRPGAVQLEIDPCLDVFRTRTDTRAVSVPPLPSLMV